MLTRVSTAALLALGSSVVIGSSAPPLVHLQTDRPSYRLGETIWFRAHGGEARPLSVRLVDPRGQEVARAELKADDSSPASGSFLIPDQLPGGAYLLEAERDGRVVHRVALEVYDLAFPELDISLEVLGDLHCPGEQITATFRARDWEGRAVKGARVEYLAAFGNARIRGHAGDTDPDGRATIRFSLPAEAEGSGSLSAGVAVKTGRAVQARRITVSSAVMSIEAFPEAGSIVEGHAQRLCLLARDPRGKPSPAEGRILDDRGECVSSFRTDDWGLAMAVVPYAADRRYAAVVDRPGGSDRRHPLPGSTGHDHSLFVERTRDGLAVEVRGGATTEHERVQVRLLAGREEVSRQDITLRRETGKGRPAAVLPSARASLELLHADGIVHILLVKDQSVLLHRPVYLGAQSPVSITVKAKKTGPLLAGKSVELEVLTSKAGRRVSADVALSIYQGDPGGSTDLALRSAVEPELAEGSILPVGFPDSSETPADGPDAFLILHGTFVCPPEGLPLGKNGLPDAKALRPQSPSALPAPGGEARQAQAAAAQTKSGRTVAALPEIERLLDRAPFTRSARPAPAAHRVELIVPPQAVLASSGLGKLSRARPQDAAPAAGQIDCRPTLFWSERLRTDSKGRAIIRFKLNDVISDLAWVAQGRAGPLPVSGRGTLSPDPGFRTLFKSPQHLHVGDTFDILLEARVTDGAREEAMIDFLFPSCLKSTLRTRLDFDPRKDARLHKFSFVAQSAGGDSELKLVARRGIYREVHTRPLRVFERSVELTRGQSGRDVGLRTLSYMVPDGAVPGSVRAHGSVSAGTFGTFFEWLNQLIVFPSGCFEQFTSKNYVNLVVLEALLDRGEDAAVLERADKMARVGFERLLEHRNRENGGFSLFPGKEPSVRPTVIALRHLALYERIFKGLGRQELEAAAAWLEQVQQVAPIEELYATLALHDSGRTWKGARRILDLEPATTCEAALQALCLARSPRQGAGAELRWAGRRKAKLEKLLASLGAALGKSPDADNGAGLMGARGGQLSVEAMSLYALALEAAGRRDEARSVAGDLVDLQERYVGTHSTALAIQALNRLEPFEGAELLQAEFRASSARPERFAALPGQVRPILFDRLLTAQAGTTVELSVNIDSQTPRPYRLALTYLLDSPKSSPTAPYRLHQRITPCVDMDQKAEVSIDVEPVGPPVASQVVARIALPGGCVIDREAWDASRCQSVTYWTTEGGYVDFYWETGLKSEAYFKIPVRAEIAGSFVARPSFIYPYYETGREHYAEPLRIKVLNTFGSKLSTEDLLREKRRGAKKAAGLPAPSPVPR